MLALSERPGDVQALFPYLPRTESAEMAAVCGELKDKPAETVAAVARSELQKLARAGTRTYLNDVHSDWLVQMLKDEPPLVLATVLRYLPAERVHDILDYLPPDVLAALPKISDTYAADERLVEILRRRFEGFFESHDEAPGGTIHFEHIHMLRSAQIRRAFAELGYREIGLGLVSLPEMTKIMLLNRLLPEDKERVQGYMSQEADGTSPRVKRAQVHLISREVDPRNREMYVRELGYIIFAKALLPQDYAHLDVLKKKLPMREARSLQTMVDHYSRANTEASVIVYREDVMVAVKAVLAGRVV
jgi:hypothetical protein